MNKNKHDTLSTEHPPLTGITLKSDETLVSVEQYNRLPISYPVSAVKAMLGLTSVTRFRDIGRGRPANASQALRKHRQDSEQAHQGKFDVFFPRDAHIVAEILGGNLLLTRTTILASLASMGVVDNYKHPTHPFDEQEVGKIPHELRTADDPIAQELTRTKGWGWPYYGAVDTTGKNILAICRYIEHADEGAGFLAQTFVGRDGKSRTVKEGFEMNLAWLTGRMDMNPEGLVESLQKNPKHHANQTWADSPEAFHHSDGSWAEHHPEKGWGVAALEQQGEAYRVLRKAAALYWKLGESEKAVRLRQRADALRSVVLKQFWVEDEAHYGGYFGRGTDRDSAGTLRPLAIRTSDMGNFLTSGMLDDDTGDEVLNQEARRKREAVIKNLLSDEMMGLNGIRTLSSDSVRYDPHRYHNGTSWPWVSYMTARGLERYGYAAEAADLDQRVLAAYQATGLLCEYFSGSNDPDHRLVNQRVVVHNPTLTTDPVYAVCQPAQEVQAWTVATALAIKRKMTKLAAQSLRK